MTFAISLPDGVACTPLGVWVYEDPGVRVSRVRMGTDSLSLAPVLIALDVQNPNDYPVSTVHVQLSLELDDERIGELNRDSAVVLPSDTHFHRCPAISRRGRFTRGPAHDTSGRDPSVHGDGPGRLLDPNRKTESALRAGRRPEFWARICPHPAPSEPILVDERK